MHVTSSRPHRNTRDGSCPGAVACQANRSNQAAPSSVPLGCCRGDRGEEPWRSFLTPLPSGRPVTARKAARKYGEEVRIKFDCAGVYVSGRTRGPKLTHISLDKLPMRDTIIHAPTSAEGNSGEASWLSRRFYREGRARTRSLVHSCLGPIPGLVSMLFVFALARTQPNAADSSAARDVL